MPRKLLRARDGTRVPYGFCCRHLYTDASLGYYAVLQLGEEQADYFCDGCYAKLAKQKPIPVQPCCLHCVQQVLSRHSLVAEVETNYGSGLPDNGTPTLRVESERTVTSHESVAQQALRKLEIFQHVQQALRVALNGRYGQVSFRRKLSTVRFMAESFERHFVRLMELEEEHGYTKVMTESKPHLSDKVDALRREHNLFRQVLNCIIPCFARLSADDRAAFEKLCDDLIRLLNKVHAHERKETELLREVFLQDEGEDG